MIEYEITDETVTVTITDEDGNVTQISVPVNSVSLSSCSLMIDPLENNIPPVRKARSGTVG